jgi:hypothetical protein
MPTRRDGAAHVGTSELWGHRCLIAPSPLAPHDVLGFRIGTGGTGNVANSIGNQGEFTSIFMVNVEGLLSRSVQGGQGGSARATTGGAAGRSATHSPAAATNLPAHPSMIMGFNGHTLHGESGASRGAAAGGIAGNYNLNGMHAPTVALSRGDPNCRIAFTAAQAGAEARARASYSRSNPS